MSALTNISTIEDVKTFFTEVVEVVGDEFHPDDDFSSYKYMQGPNRGERMFTPEEIAQNNALLAQCFEVCDAKDVDIYDLGWDVIEKYLNL